MTDLATIKDEAMTSDELDSVAGGIIIVSGLQPPKTSPYWGRLKVAGPRLERRD